MSDSLHSVEKFLEQELREGRLTGLSEKFLTNTVDFIDHLVKMKHGFSVSSAMADTFKGPNILANTPMIKPNTNQPGYIFTTRPDLNLSSANIKIERKMMPLLTENRNSLMHAIRMILSPRLAKRMEEIEFGGSLGKSDLPRHPNSNLVDPNYPFIAVSDNLVKSLTGWPSSGLGIHSTPAGILKEVHIMADGPSTYNTEYSLNLSLHAMKGSATLYLYYYWIQYIGFVLYQTYGMMPWPEYLGNGRMDYTCRIYRLIMDETRTFVEEMGATGYAIPRSVDIGPYFDYSNPSDNPRPYVDRTVDVEFACSGAIYLDEILIKQFNNTVTLFNPNMANGRRERFYVKVSKKYQPIFNNYCYPRINPISRELEWWTTKDMVKAKKDIILLSNIGPY